MKENGIGQNEAAASLSEKISALSERQQKALGNKIIDEVCYNKELDYIVEFGKDRLDIIYNGGWHHEIFYDDEESCFDVCFCYEGGFSSDDLRYSAHLLDSRDEIIEIIKKY